MFDRRWVLDLLNALDSQPEEGSQRLAVSAEELSGIGSMPKGNIRSTIHTALPKAPYDLQCLYVVSGALLGCFWSASLQAVKYASLTHVGGVSVVPPGHDRFPSTSSFPWGWSTLASGAIARGTVYSVERSLLAPCRQKRLRRRCPRVSTRCFASTRPAGDLRRSSAWL